MSKVSKAGQRRSRIPHWQILLLLGILLWMGTDLPALYIIFLGSAMAVKAKDETGRNWPNSD